MRAPTSHSSTAREAVPAPGQQRMPTPGESAQAGAALPRPPHVLIHIFSGQAVASEGANWSINLRSWLAQPSYLHSTQDDGIHPAVSLLLPSIQHHRTLDAGPQSSSARHCTKTGIRGSSPEPLPIAKMFQHTQLRKRYIYHSVDTDNIHTPFPWDSLLCILHRDQPPTSCQKHFLARVNFIVPFKPKPGQHVNCITASLDLYFWLSGSTHWKKSSGYLVRL